MVKAGVMLAAEAMTETFTTLGMVKLIWRDVMAIFGGLGTVKFNIMPILGKAL